MHLHLVALEEVGYRLKRMGHMDGFGKEGGDGEHLYLVARAVLLEWNGIGDHERLEGGVVDAFVGTP